MALRLLRLAIWVCVAYKVHARRLDSNLGTEAPSVGLNNEIVARLGMEKHVQDFRTQLKRFQHLALRRIALPSDHGISTTFSNIIPASLRVPMVLSTPLQLLSPLSMYNRYLAEGGPDLCAGEIPPELAVVCARQAAKSRERRTLADPDAMDGYFEKDLELAARDLQIRNYRDNEDLLRVCELSTHPAVGLRKVGFSGLVNMIVTMRQYVTFNGDLVNLDAGMKQFQAGPHGPLYIIMREKVTGWVTPSAWKAILLPPALKPLLIRVLEEAIKAGILQAELEGSQLTFGKKPEPPRWVTPVVSICGGTIGCGPRQLSDSRPRVSIMNFGEYRHLLEQTRPAK